MLSAFLEKRSTWVWVTALGLTAPFAIADLANVLGRPVPFSLAGYVPIGGIIVGALMFVAVVLGGGVLLGLCTAPAARRLVQSRVS